MDRDWGELDQSTALYLLGSLVIAKTRLYFYVIPSTIANSITSKQKRGPN